MSAAPTIVLDTNVVLDWLVFRNSEIDALASAVAAGGVRWVATIAMRQELGFVLSGGKLDSFEPNIEAVWSAWNRDCVETQAPVVSLAHPRCTDPDDQMFVDLAIAESARWLVTRDRALLKLAGRLRRFGVDMIVPSRWALMSASP
jgi:uncharacterized protein